MVPSDPGHFLSSFPFSRKSHVGSRVTGLSSLCSDNEIVCFLKVQLAEAINLQDKNLMAQLQETMRCVSRFDNRTCRKLLASIAEDYRYLVLFLLDKHGLSEGLFLPISALGVAHLICLIPGQVLLRFPTKWCSCLVFLQKSHKRLEQ